ncbi:MAG TPA: 4-hydroxy-tetrahydrodipicolinate reductase [Cyclobacteriaceae bacterium]|nr:4-hydroxy-tetrahydrodipicolinate reductase [Cyclobacteriaceae bacterium]
MDIVLIGYGKMGKVIEGIATQRGHHIAGRIDIDNQNELDHIKADVAIEFSHPDAAFNNVRHCLELNIPIVCGTTGWLSRKDEIEKICDLYDGAFFYASNYSLGVNIFFKVNQYLAKMMNGFSQYDVRMDEVHHTEKKDAPSGTAITLAEGILSKIERKKKWVKYDNGRADELVINSFRIAEVPGTHVVKYESAVDDIEIKHTAHSREGFALGAVMVAEWLPGKKGCLTMDDYLKF